MFFWNSFAFFDDPVEVGNLISGSSAFSKTILNILKFTVHILWKPGLEKFEHYFASDLEIFPILESPKTLVKTDCEFSTPKSLV